MESGWTRYNSSDVFGVEFYDQQCVQWWDKKIWISQANHIFSRLQITSSYENYGSQTGSTPFRWEDCPAYWSFDPSGGDRLGMEDSTQLGFPSIWWTMEIYGVHWDANVYAGLRQFHQTKGFDPESQDVAQHFGYPLYQLSNEAEALLAHVEDDPSGAEDNDGSEQECPVNDENVPESTAVECNQPDAQDFSPADETFEHCCYDADSYPVSQSYYLLTVVEFTLIIFVVLSSMYEYM
ncbi:hypothetical protein C8R44DRAFT_882834 [Mycena epipterygia]|nr:hypothetical protein C8R44DRAFT_882834 [Mycena epipterygia]